MNPLIILVNLLKPLLYPLSLIYGVIVWLRNKLYDAGIISSVGFSVPVISVGNLSTGGTGKTPHIEYLIRLLQYEYKIATMSRGYKRRTQGFRLASAGTDASLIGDEPMQFFTKFPEILVSVCEDRMTGIPRLLGERPDIDVILLDDAYQHRSVKPGLNILITDYNKPFFKDYILPFGSLREARKAYQRADIIIVSKCPERIDDQQKATIRSSIKPLPHQLVFFTGISYSQPYDFFTGKPVSLSKDMHAVLVSGIAKPEPLMARLEKETGAVHLLRYPDHHYFTSANLEEIRQTFTGWDVANKIIATTEKDATRLAIYSDAIRSWGILLVVVPVQVHFLENGSAFADCVLQYINRERSENLA